MVLEVHGKNPTVYWTKLMCSEMHAELELSPMSYHQFLLSEHIQTINRMLNMELASSMMTSKYFKEFVRLQTNRLS